MKAGVKFCGHCAPRMDMMELLDELKAAMPETEFHYYAADRPADVLLILNACQVECATVPPFSGPVVCISPDSVNHWFTPPEMLCGAICTCLSKLELDRNGQTG